MLLEEAAVVVAHLRAPQTVVFKENTVNMSGDTKQMNKCTRYFKGVTHRKECLAACRMSVSVSTSM